MQITAPILSKLYPSTKQDRITAVIEPLNKAMARFDITTPTRVAAFLAQAGHESAGFSVMAENLNYSAKGLNGVFRKYFPTISAATLCERQPAKIANKVYCNRMGNGNEASGDGYMYRGRGFIQLTGKDNYEAFAKAFGMKLSDAVTYLETLSGASMSAAWYWNSRKLNQYADQNNFTKITQLINGGQIGAADRVKHFTLAKKLLS
jgi:putative chitinase